MEHLWLLPLSIFGFVLAAYILYKKRHAERLVCVIGTDCNKVINSKYGNIFGVDNTAVGIAYYGSIFLFEIAQLILLKVGWLSAEWLFPLYLLKMAVSGIAAIFSLYLIFVQLAIIKEWCEYCLVSSLISLTIFLVVLFSFVSNVLFSIT